MSRFIAVRSGLVDFAAITPGCVSSQAWTPHLGDSAVRHASGLIGADANGIDDAWIGPRIRLLADPRGAFRFVAFRSDRGHGHRVPVRGASIPGDDVPATAVLPCERTRTQNKATDAPLSADGDERRLRYDRLFDRTSEFRRVADEARPVAKKCSYHPRRENR